MRLRKPPPTFAIAVLALFMALGGTAVAATHFLITSTSQIKPSVLRELRGRAGARGDTGTTGAQGATGSDGKTGAAGEPGHEGQPGVSGTTVVARVRIAG